MSSSNSSSHNGFFAVWVLCKDTETTGLSISDDEIIQLAALLFYVDADREWHGPVLSFSRYVSTARAIHARASAVTGITADTIKDAASLATNWAQLVQFVKAQRLSRPSSVPLVVVGHNLVDYDLPLLHNCLGRAGASLADLDAQFAFDTLQWSRAELKVLPSRTLAAVHEHIVGVPIVGAHDALADVKAVASILQRQPALRRLDWLKNAKAMPELCAQFASKQAARERKRATSSADVKMTDRDTTTTSTAPTAPTAAREHKGGDADDIEMTTIRSSSTMGPPVGRERRKAVKPPPSRSETCDTCRVTFSTFFGHICLLDAMATAGSSPPAAKRMRTDTPPTLSSSSSSMSLG
jgi:DNA polymerase III epsilon subunit-like protein